MLEPEKVLGVVKDVVLPVDVRTGSDVYFTDRRVAIVCLGRADRYESDTAEALSAMPSVFGVPPPVASHSENVQSRESIDEKIKDLSLDDILRLSKKSCFYTNDEIEEVRLVCGHGAKFVILSKECESKLSPDEEQFKQLSEILLGIAALKSKLWIAGKYSALLEMGFMKPS